MSTATRSIGKGSGVRGLSLPRAPQRLVAGAWLDRYELLHEVASGGMGSVWLARMEGKHGFEKRVAVKTILMHFADDPRLQEMFLNEAKLAARIDHPNVARILDLGDVHSLLYLVMEWVDGAGLDVLRRRARREGRGVPLGLALRIAADVASGLHAAHELRGDDGAPLHVVHRDISPHNILISASGVAKVIDFGIAKAKTEAVRSTSLGTLKGKLRYMAPEQARGDAVDRRADVWSLGAVLYELVVGENMHEGRSEMAILGRLTTAYEPPSLSPSLPPEVAALIRRCLALAPDDRFATAADLRDALEDVSVSLGVRARPEDVAAFLDELLGEDLAKRRVELELVQRSGVVEAVTRTRAAVPAAIREEEASAELGRPPGSGGRALAAVAAAAVAATLFAGAGWMGRSSATAKSIAPRAATAPPEAAVVPSPPPDLPPRPPEVVRIPPAPPPSPAADFAVAPGRVGATPTVTVATSSSGARRGPRASPTAVGKRGAPSPHHGLSDVEREAQASWEKKEEL